MNISEILLITSGLLALSMMAASLCRHIAIPHTVVLVILGVALNQASSNFSFLHILNEYQLTPDLVIFLFLPALIFESALNLNARALLKDILPVLLLAIPGLILSTAIVGLSLWSFLEIEIMIALLFGALISATDPVAVVALFKELGAPRRLNILVEGESLLNDATAIVLFNILLSLIAANYFEISDTTNAVVDFMRVFFGGIVVGIVTGVVMSELMVRLYHGNQSVQIVLSLALAYSTFIIAEHFFHVSGVMAVLVAAISLNILGISRLSQETTHAIHETWEFIVLICNSLLFLLIGLSVDIFALAGYWQPILVAVGAILLARALAMYIVLPFTVHWFSLPKISLNERHIMWWGGLKGGLAIAIVLSIPLDMANRQMLIELTLGVVLVSLIVNASSIKSVLHWLGIDRLTDDEQSEIKHGMDHVRNEVSDVMQQFAVLNLLDDKIQAAVADRIKGTLQVSKDSLSEQQLIRHVYLNTLQVEADELEYINELGIINYYNYLSFRELIYREKEKRFSLHQQKSLKVNPYVRIEMGVINFLIERDWATKLLAYYQNLRFTNQIQRDIAGVLLVNAVLESIEQQYGAEIHNENIAQIRLLYQQHLLRRQLRLIALADAYPEYCLEYKSILFQRVSLHYAIKTINHDFDSGKVGAKACTQIEKQLRNELKKLPTISSSLLLTKRYDLIENVPFFSGLPKSLLDLLATKARYVNFLPEDIIFKQNDKGDSLYILVNGDISVYRNDENDDEIKVNELQKGSFFGERALLGNKVRSATIKAKSHVTLLRLTSKKVNELAKKLPELKARLNAEDLTRREADLQRDGK